MTEPMVELVDTTGRPVGQCDKLAAHQAPGQLHRAFSVFLLDTSGRIVLQRRAASKYHSAGLWSNSCCGHPAPGQDPAEAASVRLRDELGAEIAPGDLLNAGRTIYAVMDAGSGLWEREWDHLFVANLAAELHPNPHEVGAIACVSLRDLDDGRHPGPFAAWFPAALAAVRPVIEQVEARG